MCYFTKKVLNKRFLPNRKNRWNPPVCTDERFRYVEVECGHCFECRKKKRREWRIRNYEQLKETPHAVFFTGTVSPQRYEYICKKYGYKNDGSQDNEIITKIHRLFLERIRKQTGKSVKHWCVTEKGHTNTRRIHLHGLFYAREGQTKWQLSKTVTASAITLLLVPLTVTSPSFALIISIPHFSSNSFNCSANFLYSSATYSSVRTIVPSMRNLSSHSICIARRSL